MPWEPSECKRSSTVFASSEVACKKKLAHEFGLPHFLLLNQTHEVWFSFYAIPSLLFWVPLWFISHEKDNT